MRLRVLDVLKEQNKTKYWLYIRLGLSYQNFNRLINNETSGIKFKTLQTLCEVLNCSPSEIFDMSDEN